MSADLKESPTPLAEISQAPNAFEQFLDRNQKGIFGLAIVLILVAATAIVYRGIQKSAQETAGAALTKAEDAAAFQAVIAAHPESVPAGSAAILLANSQWAAGNKDESVATLKKFIAAYPTHPARFSAKASLGAKLMSQGKSGDASTYFEELAADSAATYIAPYALISLGDIARSANDFTKAKTYYTKVQKFTDSSFTTLSTSRLATLESKPPVEIEAPPAPPAPPSPAPLMPQDAPAITPPAVPQP